MYQVLSVQNGKQTELKKSFNCFANNDIESVLECVTWRYCRIPLGYKRNVLGGGGRNCTRADGKETALQLAV